MTKKPQYYDDNDNKVDPDIIPKPDLCVTCEKDSIPGMQQIVCNITRVGQYGNREFICDAYEPKDEE